MRIHEVKVENTGQRLEDKVFNDVWILEININDTIYSVSEQNGNLRVSINKTILIEPIANNAFFARKGE